MVAEVEVVGAYRLVQGLAVVHISILGMVPITLTTVTIIMLTMQVKSACRMMQSALLKQRKESVTQPFS